MKRSTLTPLIREILQVAFYNTAIALFLAVLTPYGLVANLIYSQVIGLAIYGFVRASCRLRRVSRPGWRDGAVGIALGFAAGFPLATWLSGFALAALVRGHPQVVVVSGATALLFGVFGTWHFHDEARIADALAEAQAERLARVEGESAAAHAELARLQAQIEPHFLFNTLSNVVGLIDAEPARARAMLLDLTALLRTSLARTRATEVTLAEELDLLRAYLGIMAVRMGPRLAWQVEADGATLNARLPPLLVQPLVENAIRHGLEPKPDGGRLVVRCRREGDCLVVAVEDGGLGFAATSGEGVGLANVRRRLAACYGNGAGLALAANAGGGVSARLSIPWEPACAS